MSELECLNKMVELMEGMHEELRTIKVRITEMNK
jgi:hypothetical protein